MPVNNNEPEILCHWSARKLHPSILFYVGGIFIVFMGVSYFAFHSISAVKALAMTAFGAIASLIPGVINKIEYRLTKEGLEYRPLNQKKPAAYKKVFQLDELGHIVPKKRGFKFYLPLNESNPLRRFWKRHISDAFSGEVHVEDADREKVLDVLAQYGIPHHYMEKSHEKNTK